MPANEIITAMAKLGLSEAELMSNHCEALAGAPQVTGFGGPGRGPGGHGRGHQSGSGECNGGNESKQASPWQAG